MSAFRPLSVPALLSLCLMTVWLGGCAHTRIGNAPRPLPEHKAPLADCPQSVQLAEWQRVLESERARSSFSPEGLTSWRKPFADEWEKLRLRLNGRPWQEQAEAVNAFFNIWEFKEDSDNWGREEYWATPTEFVNHGGDCEDYVIAKYFALRYLGIPAETMCIAAVWNIPKKEGHAVLLVRINDVRYVLDNRIGRVLPWQAVFDYQAAYCLNEDFYWSHGTK